MTEDDYGWEEVYAAYGCSPVYAPDIASEIYSFHLDREEASPSPPTEDLVRLEPEPVLPSAASVRLSPTLIPSPG